MTEISEEFVEEQVEELASRKDVKAVAVVGSYARKPEANHNDLDIFILVEGEWRKRESKKVEGVVVEKFFNSLEAAENYLEGDDWWKNYHWYANWDVKYDPDNILPELEKKARKVREARLDLSEKDKEEIAYTIWDKRQDFDCDDVAQKRYLMNEFFNYLVFQFYRLEGEVPVKSNYRVENLNNFNGYMYKLSQDFLLSSSTMEKENKLGEIVDYISRQLPDTGPEWESEKESID